MLALKIFEGNPDPGLWCALARLGQALVRVKISGASTTLGLK